MRERLIDEPTSTLQEEFRLSILTFLILTLIGLLVVVTGYQAVSSERAFFKRVVLAGNQKICALMARQITQVFSNSIGTLDDLAHVPAVVSGDKPTIEYLADMLLQRHEVFRVIYFYDARGRRLVIRYRANAASARDFKEVSPDEVEFAIQHRGMLLTEPYIIGTGNALTYGRRVEDKRGTPTGLLVAEIDLSFVRDVLRDVTIGRTGHVLVVNRHDHASKVLFSWPDFAPEDFEDFKHFHVDEAFDREQWATEYDGVEPRLASSVTLHSLALRQFSDMPALAPVSSVSVALQQVGQATGVSPNPVPIKPEKLPDWLIVVQQYASEGSVLADRMKLNIFALVAVALLGLGIVAKLWIDSLA